MPTPGRLRLAAVLAALLGAACAMLPWPQGSARRPEPQVGAGGWRDLRGAVHVEARSADEGPDRLADLLDGARRAGLDWVALSERARPGVPAPAGARDGVVLIPGFELQGWGGSLLALGLEQPPATSLDLATTLAEIHRAGGLAIAGHLEPGGPGRSDWSGAAPDGLEIDELRARADPLGYAELALRAALLPGPWALRGLLHTPAESLRRWERLPATNAIVGGVDALAQLRVLDPLGGNAAAYARSFRLLTTHVLARENTPPAILDALRAGRSYVAYEGLGRVDGFRFERFGVGFSIEVPRRARLALVCDGARTERDRTLTAAFAIPEGSRRCRGEAWLGSRLWIVTSYQDVGAA